MSTKIGGVPWQPDLEAFSEETIGSGAEETSPIAVDLFPLTPGGIYGIRFSSPPPEKQLTMIRDAASALGCRFVAIVGGPADPFVELSCAEIALIDGIDL